MLIGSFALAGGLLPPAPAAAMDSAGGDSQCQNLGDMYLNEITGEYEFCEFGGSDGGGGPLNVGPGGGSGATPGTSPTPGTGLPGEVIQVSGTAPKCGYPGFICVNLGISVAPDDGRDRPRDYRPRGSGGRGAETPKKKESPKKKSAGQDTKQSAEQEENDRIEHCQRWLEIRSWARERLQELANGRDRGRKINAEDIAEIRSTVRNHIAVMMENLKSDKCV